MLNFQMYMVRYLSSSMHEVNITFVVLKLIWRERTLPTEGIFKSIIVR